MPVSPFDPSFEQLPSIIPIFPLSGALLLPHLRLPLNIFEPRYLAMISDALGAARIVGMIQPQQSVKAEDDDSGEPVYRTGCAGRIVSFNETEDQRYQIVLAGLARFDIAEELPLLRGYRRVRADWSPYRGDLAPAQELGATLGSGFDRPHFLAALKPFLTRYSIAADWNSIDRAPDEFLINTVAMVGPFAPSEKQALLEADGLEARGRILTSLVEMANLAVTQERPSQRH